MRKEDLMAYSFVATIVVATITIPLRAIIKRKSLRISLIEYAEYIIKSFSYEKDLINKTDKVGNLRA